MCCTQDSRSRARSASAMFGARSVDAVSVATPVAGSQHTGASSAAREGSTKGADLPTLRIWLNIRGWPDEVTRCQFMRVCGGRNNFGIVTLVVRIPAQELPSKFNGIQRHHVVIGTVRRWPSWLGDRSRTCHGGTPSCMARPALSSLPNTYSRWRSKIVLPAQSCDEDDAKTSWLENSQPPAEQDCQH